LKRIRREYAFINTDRGELRDKVALTIKNSRTRSSSLPFVTPSSEENKAINMPQEGMIDRLAQIEARLKNIRKKLSTGMVMKILSNSSNMKLYDDLEEIYERLTIIDLQYPDYTYKVNALKEEINSIRGFQSALVQEKTSTNFANVV
jgi:hypothetical protein